MKSTCLVSVIISSYNYGPFLRNSIESALNQTYPNTEVIVVDDCSTDNSPEIIAGYGDRVISVLKRKNEGAKATYNAGCQLSKGEVIIYLDSDDMLRHTAIERAVELFQDPEVVKVHWPLRVIDVEGTKTGRLVPSRILPDGDLREEIVCNGPFGYVSPPTSGNAFSRRLLEKILPIPPGAYVDAYPSMWALVLGTIKSIPEPQGYYREHGRNFYEFMRFDERLNKDLKYVDICCRELTKYYREKGINVDTEIWKKNSWSHCLHWAAQEIEALIPPGDRFILVDEDSWGTRGSVGDRLTIPFPERDGWYTGAPPDDTTAIQEFERLRGKGASFMAFAWPAFWWLDHYRGLQHHLRSQFACVLENERLLVFDLGRIAK